MGKLSLILLKEWVVVVYIYMSLSLVPNTKFLKSCNFLNDKSIIYFS